MTTVAQPRVTLLDCTLRDGGYAVNFQFTRRDTSRLCAALDSAGVPMIEVGHGLGLGASSTRHGPAFETDRTYVRTAADAVRGAKVGAFFIPGIGSNDDICDLKANGAGFVRIGCEVETIHEARRAAEYARSLELDVFINLMKTYAAAVPRVARVARELDSWDVLTGVYAVDSAGCMCPDEVATYVECLKENLRCAVGFHGHNNLDLANANTLAAVAAGATYVDATIRGIGRSAGNAQTEVVAFLLERKCAIAPCDVFGLFDIGESVIAPLNIQAQGLPPLDIVIGMARFHSSHLPRVRRAADSHNIDVRRLIIEVSRIDCVAPSDSLIETTAKDLSRVEPAG